VLRGPDDASPKSCVHPLRRTTASLPSKPFPLSGRSPLASGSWCARRWFSSRPSRPADLTGRRPALCYADRTIPSPPVLSPWRAPIPRRRRTRTPPCRPRCARLLRPTRSRPTISRPLGQPCAPTMSRYEFKFFFFFCDVHGIVGSGEYCGDNDAHLDRITVFYHESPGRQVRASCLARCSLTSSPIGVMSPLGELLSPDNLVSHTRGQKLGQKPILLTPPCCVAAFVVNSEPNTGAGYSTRLCGGGRAFSLCSFRPLPFTCTKLKTSPAAKNLRRGPPAALPVADVWHHVWCDGALCPCAARHAAKRSTTAFFC
jgi:hypothetical protein